MLLAAFGDSYHEEHIQSTWRKPKADTSQVESGTQTEARLVEHAGCQAPSRCHAQVQAELELGTDPDLLQLLEDQAEMRDVEAEALAGAEPGRPLQHCYNLNPFDPALGHHNSAGLVVMAVDWHPGGQALAAALGDPAPVGHCLLPGLLAIWNLAREQFEPHSPQRRIETDCALQAVAYNAAHPSLIAGGTANGELYVWDMAAADEAPEAGRSAACAADVMHQQAVRAVAWVQSSEEAGRHSEAARAFLICTVGGDGRLLLWRWHACSLPIYGMLVVEPVQRSPMMLRSAAFRVAAAGAQPGRGAPSIRVAADSEMQVGSETGHVYKCSLAFRAADVAAWESLQGKDSGKAKDTQVKWSDANPASNAQQSKLAKRPHIGAVTALAYCPRNSQALLSAGLDGRVRFWGPRGQELLLVEPFDVGVTAAAWSLHNPTVFVAASQDGRLAVYDLAVSANAALDTFDVVGLDQAVWCVAFSPAAEQARWLAASNVDNVAIYRVSRRLHGNARTVQRGGAYIQQMLDAEASMQ